jgi:hypothetical protein
MKWQCVLVSLLLSIAVKSQVITTIAGKGSSGFTGEGGLAINAEFNFLTGVATDKWGNIYVADLYNNVIQKIDVHGILSRFAGNGSHGHSGDGGPATAASLYVGFLEGIVADSMGNIFIATEHKIRKVDVAGIITTFAGTGVYGSSGDGGPATAAKINTISGLCFDKAGNLYIVDEGYSNVRKVNTASIISTVAGTGTAGFSGDGGPATNAQLSSPRGIAIDDWGNLYIADALNYRVRKINTSGIISTIAGVGTASGPNVCFGCDALIMQINAPTGIATDAYGNVYLSALTNDVVHKIAPNGKIYPVAGTGDEGYSGDGGPGTAARLHSPTMICLDPKGNLLIADKGNARIRKVWLDPTVHTPPAPTPLSTITTLLVSPNPVKQKNISCTVQSGANEGATLVITDVLGKLVTTATCTTNVVTNISLPVPSGMYFISATTASGKRMSAKIVVE